MKKKLKKKRMANINNSGNNRCWRGCRERGSLLHCWWECKLVQPLWKTVWRFLKKLKRHTWPADITHHQGNTNQNHNEIPPHTSEWLTLTIQATTDVGKDMEKEDLFCSADGSAKWCSHSGKHYGGTSKN